MASPDYKIHANTAAELLHYRPYDKPKLGGGTEQCWTRFATADENFNVVAGDGSQFLVKFDMSFSKKHLVTFSKKEWRTEEEKWLQSKQPGQRTDEENWNNAQKQLLDNKILKTLGICSGKGAAVNCKTCGHPKSNNPPGSGHSANPANPRCMVNGCACVAYVSRYVEERRDEGKPDIDPYVGKSGQESTCIVLNWIPKSEFIRVVGDSITAADHGNALPDSVPHPYTSQTPFIHLTWTFAGRPGAVRSATNGALALENGTWCRVGAFKSTANLPGGIAAIWTIAHLDNKG